MKPNLNKILKKEKAMYLSYDQGIEHGPADFNDKNINPKYIIEIAKKGKFTGIVFQKGIAEKYSKEIRKSKIPLIIKLNGKTNLYQGEPISEPICTVKEAIKLRASAVGFTIYIGSKYESHMLRHFAKIEKEAHGIGLPVIVWVYPRGKSIKGKKDSELMAYACRVGLEIGADIVKIHWNGNLKDLQWAVKSAGKTKVVIAGGLKTDEKTLLKNAKDIMNSGAIGLAIGRNVWQNSKPLEITKKIRKIIWSNNKK
ncbi:fructose-bisphosphate aldolase [Candidatus Pacearchaeota archaeon]|nr:fructose-bisphosphate aldolase [Candidatus Pacearchaeota archaeon]